MSEPDTVDPARPSSGNRVVVYVDAVDSVGQMHEHAQAWIRVWRGFVDAIEGRVLAGHAGRIAERRGDSVLILFENARAAVRAAFDIHRLCAEVGQPGGLAFSVRIGMDAGEVTEDRTGILGNPVNLAARLREFAGPGEIVVSGRVRDEITPVLDADVEDVGAGAAIDAEDLGRAYVRGLREPVRTYRIGPPGPSPVIEAANAMPDLRPTIAVIPFTSYSDDPRHAVIGELLADDIIAGLSRTSRLQVISRLSTTAFRDRAISLGEIAGRLKANYVLHGSYTVSGDRLVVRPALVDASTERPVWADRQQASLDAVLSGHDDLVGRLVRDTGTAIIQEELQRARLQPLPTLESYTLLMSAIGLVHRGAPQEFERSRLMLAELDNRVRRHPQVHAWLAYWHVRRVGQGWSDDRARDTAEANRHADLAVDRNDADPWALSVRGLVSAYLGKDLEGGIACYDRALELNPSATSAWVWSTSANAWLGDSDEAVRRSGRAIELSPLDPMMYTFTSIASTAHAVAGNYEQAIAFARRSLRENRMFTSTHRLLAISLALAGRIEEAREAARTLLSLEPTLTVGRFRQRYPGSAHEHADRFCRALEIAGVPK